MLIGREVFEILIKGMTFDARNELRTLISLLFNLHIFLLFFHLHVSVFLHQSILALYLIDRVYCLKYFLRTLCGTAIHSFALFNLLSISKLEMFFDFLNLVEIVSEIQLQRFFPVMDVDSVNQDSAVN